MTFKMKGMAAIFFLLLCSATVLFQVLQSEKGLATAGVKKSGDLLDDNQTVLVFGLCTNRTEHAFITVEAVNLLMVRIVPFEYMRLRSHELVCFSTQHRGFVGPHFLVTMGPSPLLAAPLDLLVSVSIDKQTYQQNESVQVVVSVFNHATMDALVLFLDTQIADYFISDAADQVVYRWSEGRIFFPTETPLIVPAGESCVILTDAWDQQDNEGTQVASGSYHLEGMIPSSYYTSEQYSEPVYFGIE